METTVSKSSEVKQAGQAAIGVLGIVVFDMVRVLEDTAAAERRSPSQVVVMESSSGARLLLALSCPHPAQGQR